MADSRVPSISGRMEVNLTVRDLSRSATWYAELLGMEKRYEYDPSDGRPSYICLTEPRSGLVLCLVGHSANPGEPFSEFRTGLDHAEFLVARRADLDEWAARLDQLGIEHSGVTQPSHTRNAMLTSLTPTTSSSSSFGASPCLRATTSPDKQVGVRRSAVRAQRWRADTPS